MATKRLIGRVLATEKSPTTIDEFFFWTNSDTKLNAFDIVKVVREDGTDTYGVIESISHITDATSFLTNFISADFGNVDTIEPTYRIGMNYARAKVTYNTGEPSGDYTPVHNNSKVYLADESEITKALGLDKVKNKLVCGSLKMYEGTADEVTLPVCLDRTFLLGSEGAHLNISGISGLAAKTSYAMFLMKSIQDTYADVTDEDESVAFVLFNVKGRDLMAIDCPNDEVDEKTLDEYTKLELTNAPFKQAKYYVPFSDGKSSKQSTYLAREDVTSYINAGKLKKFKYVYSEDKESIEMMFANVEDPNQTMEAIVSKIIDESDSDFGGLSDWGDFLDKVSENSQKGSSGSKGEISVLSWRKFKRIVNKAIKNDDMFANRVQSEQSECRLADALKRIKKNEVHVIDIAKLQEDKQAFVFGDVVKTIYNLKLGEYDNEGVSPPARIVIFIDELNKYASSDVPKSSPILRQILDVTERGRSLGVVLFGAEQFRSAIHKRVTGNCATHAYGRTNSIETSTGEYKSLPETYRNMLTRLSQGEYLIQNPVFRSLLKIKFPKPIYKQFK
jgi:DNA helicase HerA-like ATPase